jgi:hypothetical protein
VDGKRVVCHGEARADEPGFRSAWRTHKRWMMQASWIHMLYHRYLTTGVRSTVPVNVSEKERQCGMDRLAIFGFGGALGGKGDDPGRDGDEADVHGYGM